MTLGCANTSEKSTPKNSLYLPCDSIEPIIMTDDTPDFVVKQIVDYNIKYLNICEGIKW